VGTRSLPRG